MATDTTTTSGPSQMEAKVDDFKTRFDAFVKKKEMKEKHKNTLYDVLSKCEIVLVCDDSGSMKEKISPDSKTKDISQKTSTRWMEEKKLAAEVIQYSIVGNPNGLSIYFLNRGVHHGIKEMAGLGKLFEAEPDGYTPTNAIMRQIYRDYAGCQKQVVVVVITDGHPSDNDWRGNECLKRTFQDKPANFHISLAECTDEEETMRFLDEWDKEISNFDNNDDYREELEKVRSIWGPSVKFTYNDYVLKILLATFDRDFYNLDQQKTTQPVYTPPHQTYDSSGQSAYVAPTYYQAPARGPGDQASCDCIIL